METVSFLFEIAKTVLAAIGCGTVFFVVAGTIWLVWLYYNGELVGDEPDGWR